MTEYRYLFADLLTDQIVGELPLTGVNFTQQINSIGTFTGHLLLSGVNAYGLNVEAATVPGRTAVYVDRDGVLVWGGVLWKRDYRSDTQQLSLTAQEFESYFQKRLTTSTQTFAGVDQFTVAETLVSDAQAVPYGNIGVQVGSGTSGVLITKTYYGYELKNVYQALQDLSRASSGFDFRIQVSYDGGYNPVKTLMLGYPRIGTVYSASSTSVPVFEFPAGNVVSYEYPEEGANTANRLYGIGAGSNEGKLIVDVSDAGKFAAGWPLLESTVTYSDYTDSTLLTNLVTGQVSAVSYPPVTMKIVAPPYVDPVLGSYKVGDDCRVRIVDDRFPTGVDGVYRITALNVAPGEDGPERATLTVTLPTASV